MILLGGDRTYTMIWSLSSTSVWGEKVMISYRFLKVFSDSSARRKFKLADLELKFYLSMGSKSNDFTEVFNRF